MKLYLFLFLSISLPTQAGVLVDNDGGDSIYCLQSQKFPYEGYYVLDYAVSFPKDRSRLSPVRSWQESLDRIESLLAEKAPDHLDSFRAYRASLEEVSSHGQISRRWFAWTSPLNDIRDEGILKQVPKECRLRRGNRKYARFLQTVVRKSFGGGKYVVYQYDKEIVSQYLNQEEQLQASILFVHEWLWDYYSGQRRGSASVRHANAFLHSLEADRASPDKFQKNTFKARPLL